MSAIRDNPPNTAPAIVPASPGHFSCVAGTIVCALLVSTVISVVTVVVVCKVIELTTVPVVVTVCELKEVTRDVEVSSMVVVYMLIGMATI